MSDRRRLPGDIAPLTSDALVLYVPPSPAELRRRQRAAFWWSLRVPLMLLAILLGPVFVSVSLLALAVRFFG